MTSLRFVSNLSVPRFPTYCSICLHCIRGTIVIHFTLCLVFLIPIQGSLQRKCPLLSLHGTTVLTEYLCVNNLARYPSSNNNTVNRLVVTPRPCPITGNLDVNDLIILGKLAQVLHNSIKLVLFLSCRSQVNYFSVAGKVQLESEGSKPMISIKFSKEALSLPITLIPRMDLLLAVRSSSQ